MEIELTQGYKTIIDDEDYEKIKDYNWVAHKSQNRVIACTRIMNNGKRIRIQMHRFLLNISDKNIIIDHINRNPLDNRKCNLRICTYQQNAHNRGKQSKKCKSIYKGVYFRNSPNRKKQWQARITIGNKKIRLGCYYTEKEAAEAYDKGALKYFKEFAYLNFKKDIDENRGIQ